MSAFQALGPFISTFADPTATGLYFDHDGILRVKPSKESIQSTHKGKQNLSTHSDNKQEQSNEAAQHKPASSSSDSNETTERFVVMEF